jgi:hypothetical protein
MEDDQNNRGDGGDLAALLERVIFGGETPKARKPKQQSPSHTQLRRDYFEKEVQPKPLTKDQQFLADFDPSLFSQDPKVKRVNLSSKQHIAQLKKTIAHLEQLKTVFKAGSANRMVVSQTCGKLKRMLKKLEQHHGQTPSPLDSSPEAM